MATKKAATPAAPPPPALPQPSYPAVERFLEDNDADAAKAVFADTREKLAALPKAKGPQAKKALEALDAAEALFVKLFVVKATMSAAAKPSKSRR